MFFFFRLLSLCFLSLSPLTLEFTSPSRSVSDYPVSVHIKGKEGKCGSADSYSCSDFLHFWHVKETKYILTFKIRLHVFAGDLSLLLKNQSSSLRD